MSAYEKLIENGIRVTAGGAAAISAQADLYDEILNPFGAVDTSDLEFTDVPEGHEQYDAVHFVFENGLMASLEDETFGVEEDATVGELAGALYGLLGEDPEAQEEAVAFLAQYGIVPASASADTPLTAKQAQDILTTFSAAVELDFTPDKNATDKGLTRGDLAVILTDYVQPLL